MHVSLSLQSAHRLHARLPLQCQLGACGTAIGNVHAINVPSIFNSAVENHLELTVGDIALLNTEFHRILELRPAMGVCQQTYNK